MATLTGGPNKRKKLVYKQDADGVFRLQKIDNKLVNPTVVEAIADEDNELHECPYTPIEELSPVDTQTPETSPSKSPMPIRMKKSPVLERKSPYYGTKVIPVEHEFQPPSGAPPIEPEMEAEPVLQETVPVTSPPRAWHQLRKPGFNLPSFATGFCIPSLLYVLHPPLMRSTVLISLIFILYGLQCYTQPHRMIPLAQQYWANRRRGVPVTQAQAEAAAVIEEEEPEYLEEIHHHEPHHAPYGLGHHLHDRYNPNEVLCDEFGNILDEYYDEYPDPKLMAPGYKHRNVGHPHSPFVRQHRAGSMPEQSVYPAPTHLHQIGQHKGRERLNSRADGALPLPENTTYHQRELALQEEERERQMRHNLSERKRVMKVASIHRKPGLAKDLPMPPYSQSARQAHELPFMNEVKNLDRDDDMMGLRRNNTVGSKRSILGTRANYNKFVANADDY